MTNFINKFKIPTLLGLSIILLGLLSGVYLVLREQILTSQAAPNLTPQNITFTNMTEDTAVISWQTNSATPSFITFGQNNPGEQTVLEDRDTSSPKPRLTHYVTLENLLPQTSYQFRIISGKVTSAPFKFETAPPSTSQTGFTPIIGSVLDNDGRLENGIAYLSIQGATTQSSLVKTGGSFLIPISQIRKADLSDVFPLTEGTIGKITIISDQGNASLLLTLKASSEPLSSIKLGQDIDLTNTKDLDRYDLNSDGKINAADNAIVLQNFGKNPKNKGADLNGDGVVDQKDLGLMSQKFKE